MSPQAQAISNLFILTMIIAGIICAGIIAVILYSIVRYRVRPGQNGEPPQIFGNTRLEIAWTVIPFIIVTFLFGTSVSAMLASSPGQVSLQGAAAHNPNRIHVVGHQWWWEVSYPSGVVTANVIHIPVGQRWVVDLNSADVIHSLWIPQCSPKVDAVPGQTDHLWLECDKAGIYHGNCSEFCGAGHAWMLVDVVAEPLATFQAWERRELRPAPAPQSLKPPAGFTSQEVVAGARLFQSFSCQGCHYIQGVTGKSTRPTVDYAPDLTHMGSRSVIGSGVVPNTPYFMEQWLLDPDKIKPGVHMPNFQLSTPQARDLTAYLESLQ
jgi:cytochrome c oxidase subunit 2